MTKHKLTLKIGVGYQTTLSYFWQRRSKAHLGTRFRPQLATKTKAKPIHERQQGLRLQPNTSVKQFVHSLKSFPDVEVVVASRPRGYVVTPDILDVNTILDKKWDLLVLLRSPENGIPAKLRPNISGEYSAHVGIPSKLVKAYPEVDARLKREASTVKLTGALDNPSPKVPALEPHLARFMDELTKIHDKPVTMLNMLHFHPGGKPKYYKYGQGFQPVAEKRGGQAKLVGNVVKPPAGRSDSRGDNTRPEGDWWNEISIVHYPSIQHFCDMIIGEDYHEINTKHRLEALRDTFLLCTTEFDVEESDVNPKL